MPRIRFRLVQKKGGHGSGDWGHAGRHTGEVGGSAPITGMSPVRPTGHSLPKDVEEGVVSALDKKGYTDVKHLRLEFTAISELGNRVWGISFTHSPSNKYAGAALFQSNVKVPMIDRFDVVHSWDNTETLDKLRAGKLISNKFSEIQFN